MKPKAKRIQIGIIFIILLASCASSNKKQFSMDTQILSSADYGYTPENPILIWAPTIEGRKEKVDEFLKGLRSEKGEQLQIIRKELIPNPNYKPPRVKIYNIYTNEIINKKKGEFIQAFSLESPEEKDTVNLYIATHTKNRTLVPVGLSFASN